MCGAVNVACPTTRLARGGPGEEMKQVDALLDPPINGRGGEGGGGKRHPLPTA